MKPGSLLLPFIRIQLHFILVASSFGQLRGRSGNVFNLIGVVLRRSLDNNFRQLVAQFWRRTGIL